MIIKSLSEINKLFSLLTVDRTITFPDKNMTVAGEDVVIGVGQTWQDVTASRVIGITYTNTTGKPIMVAVKSYVALNNGIHSLDMYVNNVLIYQHEASIVATAAMQLSGVIIVPPGATYKIGETGFTTWFELR